MKRLLLLLLVLTVGSGFLWSEGQMEDLGHDEGGGAEYVGSAECSHCHGEIYETFMKSGHPWKLNKVVDNQPTDYPFTEVPNPPEGYTWEDITYVIGGYNWKARFIGKDGFIITGEEGNTDFLGQYNFANPIVGNDEMWVNYNQGETRPYNCGTCHTTGYSSWPPDAHQDDLPGLIGTWTEPGVHCEACHGPGSLHASNPRGFNVIKDRDGSSCGDCHFRGAVEEVDAKGGFIKHHEQYEELFQSKHVTLNCIDCHDPHAGVVQLRKANLPTTRTQCANCHFQEAKYQASEIMQSVGVECIDCHMPRVTKSAVGNAAKFTGDIRTHLMAIDATQIEQFTEDGSKALSELGLNFSCRSCHVEGGGASIRSDQELKESAYNYHARPATL